MSVAPEIVREAVESGLITRDEAMRYLVDPSPSPRTPWLTPKSPPPPERLRAVVLPDRRIRRPPASATKRLIAAGLVDHHLSKPRTSVTCQATDVVHSSGLAPDHRPPEESPCPPPP